MFPITSLHCQTAMPIVSLRSFRVARPEGVGGAWQHHTQRQRRPPRHTRPCTVAAALPPGVDRLLAESVVLCKIVPEGTRLVGDFTANKLKAMLFPDLATPGTGLLIFAGLVALLAALARLEVGKNLFNFATTDEAIPRSVEEVEEAMKIRKEVPPEQQTAEQAGVVEELLREKQELLHERERGLVWLAGVTLLVFWCAGLVNTL